MRRLLPLALALALAGCGGGGDEDPSSPGPSAGGRTETLATGLEAPWDMAFLPDGRALVTERPGRVRILDANGELQPEPAATVDVVASGGAESGLLGVAVDPEFADGRPFVYLYRSTPDANQVVRYRLEGDAMQENRVIVDGIPVGAIHNGGRLAFGPDGYLYITTGEVGDQELARDPGSLGGKVLRTRDFRADAAVTPEVFTLGHRNVQGLDWQPGTDRLVATEFGPDADDEVNVLERGGDYGWPDAQGGDTDGGSTAAAFTWEDVIAPSGATFVTGDNAWRGDFLVAALVGRRLVRMDVEDDGAGQVSEAETLLDDEAGRLRAVVEGPDGAIYVLTSNRDGRGDPAEDDDRILKVTPPGA